MTVKRASRVITAVSQNQEVQWLRGWAILGVIAIHTSASFVAIQTVNWLSTAVITMDVVAHYAVPLFVVISGYVLASRYGRLRSRYDVMAFYRRRFSRLLPPYLAFSALYFAIAALRGAALTPTSILLDLSFGNAHYHLWYVTLIAQFYLLFPVILAVASHFEETGHPERLLAYALVAQLAWNILTLLWQPDGSQPDWGKLILGYRFFPSHLFYFCAGIYAALNRTRAEQWLRHPNRLCVVAISLTAITVATWVTAVMKYGDFYQTPPQHFIISTLVEPALYMAFVLLLSRWADGSASRTSRSSKFLISLGGYSFGIYLIHELFRLGAVSGLRRVGITPADWLFYPVVFMITLALSAISVRWLSSFPLGATLVGSSKPSGLSPIPEQVNAGPAAS